LGKFAKNTLKERVNKPANFVHKTNRQWWPLLVAPAPAGRNSLFVLKKRRRSSLPLKFATASIPYFLRALCASITLAFLSVGGTWLAQNSAMAQTTPGDKATADYFKTETAKLSDACLSDIHSLADWQARRPELQQEAREMLGLDPMPERTALEPVITGKIEEKDFTVEKLYFQSRPHLYVTADLYLPKPLLKPAPAVLYLCGHLPVIINGVSYGNKAAYQHHGIWFARNGYVCLILDTLEFGEILGHHKGTYDEGAWWWNSRGYTPAGVETWDAIRGLDYLSSLAEVDTNRLGVTGRSGGGAYSWFLAAVDDRVKVIAPVAGITDLKNYCVDGTVDDHCDCMFLVNRYRWDYPLLAALCAPRPLLLANTDTDEHFPLDGVLHTHDLVKRIYDLYGASTNFGLVIAPGPHKDTQDVQLPVFRWFNLHLKGEDPTIEMAAVKMFQPQELKVFSSIPDDQINTRIEDSFVPEAATPEVPTTSADWEQMKDGWMNDLREKCFAGWPVDAGAPGVRKVFSKAVDGIQYEEYEVESEHDVTLPIYIMRKAGTKPRQLFLRVPGSSYTNVMLGTESSGAGIQEVAGAFGRPEAVGEIAQEIKKQNTAFAVFLPRGIGPTAWSGGGSHETQLRRRFMLLGQTLDGMRVWDIGRAAEALHSLKGLSHAPLSISADGGMGVNVLYASLFVPGISALDLRHMPARQVEGPDYLNVLKVLDIPQAAAMAAERCPLQVQSDETNGWEFLRAMAASPVANLKVEWVEQ
jgi:hypothetical protein